ncbi:MAG: hypothetical protein JHD35_06120 [Sphingopyxis sp.]|jgi:hypothetical protein|nr:hypothetical protein [Sphingopyxis sp.]OHD04534.1 MAG: hypothetical protein A2095_02695 [Sphingomonadales bacterium GWF1_63_6]|tara:strand:+ start:22426 stop:22653 length:228 start_codon:yes stop_codon:yes gene_type:complete
MTTPNGTPEEKLAWVQDIVSKIAPDAKCELQLYNTQIGCGALDSRNGLQEIKFAVRTVSEWIVVDQAKALASRLR